MISDQLVELQKFLSDMRNLVSQGAYFHYGDLLWRMINLSNSFDETKDIKIWKKDNTVIGFVFNISKENNPEILINPQFYNSLYSEEMLKYSIRITKSRNENYFETSCLNSDLIKSKYLESKGFIKQNDKMVLMEMSITEVLDSIPLSDNYSFINIEKILNYQNSLSWLNAMQLGNIVNQDIIKDCISSFICFNNREIVSGSFLWFDTIGQCGVFEPVETCKSHQKKGLANIGMRRSLFTLKNKGAKMAYVKTVAENEPAIELYKKIGFKIFDEDFGWRLDF